MTLSFMQIIGLAISILGIAGLAIWSGTRPQSYGNVNSSPIVAGIIMGTLVGGSSTVGTAQLAFQFGMSAWWFTLGGGIGCLIVALIYAKSWRESGSMTLIGIITKEYGPKAGLAASVMSSVGTFINIIAQLIAGTAVIEVIVPSLGLVPALIITALFMTLYVILGGTQGAGKVGILKLLLIYISMVACGIMVLNLTGGLSGFIDMVNHIANPDGVNFYSLIARGAGKDIGAAISLILGILTTQTYAQAVMSGKTNRSARTGALISAFLIPPIGIAGILVGLYMRANFPDIIPKNALVEFTTMYMPPILSGLILGTLFIAVVGTGAGLASGISTIVRRDIIQRYSDKMDDKRNQLYSKIIVIIIMVLGVLLSSGPFGDTILGFSFMSMGLRGAVVFLPMTLALWARGKINPACIMVSIIASPLTVLLFGTVWSLPAGIDPLFAGVAVSMICCLIGAIIGNKQKVIKRFHETHVDKDHMIIAIDSELCSGAPDVAVILGERLNIPCYDLEILTEASRVSGIPESEFRRYDERFVVEAFDYLVRFEEGELLPPTGVFVQSQIKACRNLAKKGSCILVNRFATHALDDNKDLIKIYVDMDFELRAKVFGELNNVGDATARKRLRKMERTRTRYYKNEDSNWGTPGYYDFVINATVADSNQIASEITDRLEGMIQ